MHPKSKDRSGNDKLLADSAKARKEPPVGARGRGRQSPYARKLEAMRQVRAIKQMIKDKEGTDQGATPETESAPDAEATGEGEEE